MRTLEVGSAVVVKHNDALHPTTVTRIGKRLLWVDVTALPPQLDKCVFDQKTGYGWGAGFALFPLDDAWDTLKLTGSQRAKLETIWAVYGNNGPKHSENDHQFMRGLLELGRDLRQAHPPSEEIRWRVDVILAAGK